MFTIQESDEIIKKIISSKKLNYLQDWKFDKLSYSRENKKVTKIELYNYFDRNNLEKIIKHLNTKKYRYTNDFKNIPSLFSILLSKENKHTNGQGKIINDISKTKYFYYVDFIKALVHRGTIFLIKIYRNKSNNSNFSKIEISYYYNNNSKYNLYYGTWINNLKSINEIIKRISKVTDFIGYKKDFSKKIDFLIGFSRLINIYPKKTIEKILKLI